MLGACWEPHSTDRGLLCPISLCPPRGQTKGTQPCEGPAPACFLSTKTQAQFCWGSILPIEFPGGGQSELVGGQGECWWDLIPPMFNAFQNTASYFSRQDWANSSSVILEAVQEGEVTLSLPLHTLPPPHPHPGVSPLGMSPDLTRSPPTAFPGLVPFVCVAATFQGDKPCVLPHSLHGPEGAWYQGLGEEGSDSGGLGVRRQPR